MAATKSLQSLITCGICTERFQQPKVLPCHHSFCEKCLEGYFNTCNKNRIFKASNFPCPQCRSVVHIPAQGISGFPSDFRVLQLCEVIDNDDGDSAPRCGVCSSMESYEFCLQCMKDLCQKCCEHHRENPLFNQHSTISIDTKKHGFQCDKHKEIVKYFCSDCNKPLCVICALSVHSKHSLLDINTALVERRHKLEKKVGEIQEELNKCEEYGKELMNKKRENEEKKEKKIREIEVMAKEEHRVIEHKRVKKMNELDEVQRKISNEIEQEESLLRKRVEEITLVQRQVIESADPIYTMKLLVDYTQIEHRVGDVLNRKDDMGDNTCNYKVKTEPVVACETPVTVVSSDKKAEQTSNKISTASLTLTKNYESEDDEVFEDADHEKNDTKVASSKVEWKKGAAGVRDAVFYNDFYGILCYNEAKFHAFNFQGEEIDMTSDLMKPWACILSENHFVITDQGDMTVKMINEKYEHVQTWRRLFSMPSAVAAMRDGEYVISDIKRKSHKISILLPSGMRVRNFATEGSERGCLHTPNYAVVDGYDRIIVTDCGNNDVRVFDRLGKQLLSFSNGPTMRPQGVAVNERNEILVADQTTQKVQMFSADGRYIQDLLRTEGTPWGIKYKDSHLLAASDYGVELHSIQF